MASSEAVILLSDDDEFFGSGKCEAGGQAFPLARWGGDGDRSGLEDRTDLSAALTRPATTPTNRTLHGLA